MRARPACIIPIFLLLTAMSWGQQQDRPLLRIDSPPDGTIVHPGETITLLVSSPAGFPANSVWIFAGGGIKGGPAGSLPARLPVTIPAKLDTGRYTVTALAWNPKMHRELASIELDVEMLDSSESRPNDEQEVAVERMAVELSDGSDNRPDVDRESPVEFSVGQGQVIPIKVTATDSRGRKLDVTDSPKLTLTSSDDNVITLFDRRGPSPTHRMLRSAAPGKATVTATYVEGGKSLQALIKGTVATMYLSSTPSFLDFGTVRIGSSVKQQVRVTYVSEDPTVRIVEVNLNEHYSTGGYSQTNDCVSSSPAIAKGTCTVTVTLAPTWPGNMEGYLCIHPNWFLYPTCVVFVGRATAP